MLYHNIIGFGALAIVMVMSNAASLSSVNSKFHGTDTSTGVLKTSRFDSFDHVVEFFRDWFQALAAEDQITGTEPLAQDTARNKRRSEGRQGSNMKSEYTFEDYERFYLADRIINSIKQIYFKAISKPSVNLTTSLQGNGMATDSPHTPAVNSSTTVSPSTTTESSRTDRKMEQMIAQLTNATVAQLQEALKGIEEAAEHALEDLGISSVCCALG